MTDRTPKLLVDALGAVESALIKTTANLKLAIDLRNRVIHGYDAVDDEIVYLTVTKRPGLAQG